MVRPGFPHSVRFGHALAGTLCVVAILSLAGCGDGGPKLVKVTGKLQHHNKLHEQSSVWFEPETSDGKHAEAITGPDGSFVMTTTGIGEGVVPGKYKVGVRFAGKGPPPPRDLQKYASPKTTPITVEVPPEGLADYEIRLK
jgi:hypothetical protein